MKEKLFLVLLGALCGAVPTILNSWFQADLAAKQRTVERKLDAIRGFSAACYRGVAISQRALEHATKGLELAIFHTYNPNSNDETARKYGEYVEAELRVTQKEFDEAFVAYRAETALTNALFGTKIAPGDRPVVSVVFPIAPLTPREIEEFQRQLMDFKVSVESMQQKCEVSATQLTTALTEGS